MNYNLNSIENGVFFHLLLSYYTWTNGLKNFYAWLAFKCASEEEQSENLNNWKYNARFFNVLFFIVMFYGWHILDSRPNWSFMSTWINASTQIQLQLHFGD